MSSFVAANWNGVADPELFYHDEGYYVIKFQYFPLETPLWVTFPKLPMQYWHGESLSRIASHIGTPIVADECTSKKTRISYARMLIEVNVTKPLPEVISIMDPDGSKLIQEVEYDWKPEFCPACLVAGHKSPPQMAPPRTEVQQLQKVRRNRGPRKDPATTQQPTYTIQQQAQKQSNGEVIDGGQTTAPSNSLNFAKFPVLGKTPVTTKNAAEKQTSGNCLNNYQHAANGRAWFIWDAQWYDVTLVEMEAQFLHCMVKGKTDGFEAVVTVVYGFNGLDQRKALWLGLQRIGLTVSKPWLVWGDFNAALSPIDRLMGNPVIQNEMQDFSDCIHNLSLNELSWKGEFYTWTNKQSGKDKI
ncbi:uncharacterized protein LOC132637341 [Lycium barbarum]|uniref:uncharacterized protein LOC132637341 n=1 Tax=Lycium barbarum TaxID=112863 RepID=UPI00293E8BEF|nr:uncharacterized protein LOC132637341 [Lycium barbarum]